MTQTELLKIQLLKIGYNQEQATSLISMYSDNNKLSELESYVCIKEMTRGVL